MNLNDLLAAQIEAQFFFYIALGASTTCLCLAMYISSKIVAEAVADSRRFSGYYVMQRVNQSPSALLKPIKKSAD